MLQVSKQNECFPCSRRSKEREIEMIEIDNLDEKLISNRSISTTVKISFSLFSHNKGGLFCMNNNSFGNMKIVELNYGNVEVGKVAVKAIEVWNESCRELVYQVQRDPITNPLDHVFNLRSYTWTVAPEEKFLCEIRYRPLVVSSKNVDYFIITDTSGACMKIIVYGYSIGPKVTCSTTKLIMNCTNKNPEVKRRIKLMNNSRVPATFMLSIDGKYKPFQLDTKCGVIGPCAHKYITITFTSQKDGTYTYYVTVLILYHEPIIIELYGHCSSYSFKKTDIKSNTYPFKEINGFKAYVRDKVDSLGNLPPVSLSKHYFNFGQADVDVENIMQRIPHAICLTNHNNSNVFISWEKDSEEVFTISPSEIQVRANQCALFELTFNPNMQNNLFGRELTCSVFMEEKKRSSFPFITSITAIGHSFPVISNGWIPQYEIPQTVIMPPCVPPSPVYTSFLIKKFGHLPLVFQFVPPPASHFTVKPMLGLIYQDYQIIVVEMISEPKNEQIYIERWSIRFNGNMKNESYIDFKGYAEYANITFNGNNILNFPPVLPGCQQFAQLGMRNVTRHRIKYQFYQLPPELNIQYMNGELDPNDTLCQECFFCPTESNIDYDFEVQCVLSVTKNDHVIGSKSCISLRVRGKSDVGSLEALQQELNFGELEYNDTKTLTFDLVNSSSVNIYYKLICTHLNLPLENIEEDVKIHPVSETIFSGTHTKIMVSITPRTPIYYQFAIQYLTRINFRSDILVAKQSPTKLCNVYCMCILPTIQVQNICAFGCKQNFSINISKPFLWRALQINRLNTILKKVLPGEQKTMHVNLFPMSVNQGTVLIEWTMMNPTKLPVSLIVKKIKQCSCQPVVKLIGFSRHRIDTNCVHKDLCTLHQETQTLKPEEETVIGMSINFALVGKTVLSWDLDIGHDRHIILNIVMNCLTESEAQDNFLTTELLKFGKTYFGNKDAAYKVLWIYNITHKDLPFSVDVLNIYKFNKDYRCEVFSCLTEYGIVKAGAPAALLFRFQPRMFGAYKVTFPITMGVKTSSLTLEGEASFDYRSVDIGQLIPRYCTCKTVYFPAYFSIDCIDTWHIPTHSVIAKMLLIYNDLDYDALGYEWTCQNIPEIMYVDVFPRKGILRPSAVRSFRIKIYTKGCPCRINVNIPCVFFNASERREYQRSVIKHHILSKELEGQFTIKEKGTFTPNPWLKIASKPQQYHKTLSLRCSIYSAEDERIRVNLLDELKAAPSNMIYIDNKSNSTIINEEECFIVTFILEGMIWDIVNSRKFQKIVNDNLVSKRNLYYSQFMMDLWDRRRLLRRSYTSPPATLIGAILEKMLFTIVHEEFSLKTSHLVPNDDVRHRHYFKLLPKEKRTDLGPDLKKDREIRSEEDEESESQYLRTRFRVSFAE